MLYIMCNIIICNLYILLALVGCSIYHLLNSLKSKDADTRIRAPRVIQVLYCQVLIYGRCTIVVNRGPHGNDWLNNWSTNITVVDIHNIKVATHSLKSTVAHKYNTPLICTLLLCQVVFLHTRYDRSDRSMLYCA